MAESRRPDLLALSALALAACAVRAIAWTRTAVLFDDGPLFLYMADAVGAGDWSAILRHPYHPLYSALIWASGPLAGGDLEQAGALVSIVSGSVAVVALTVFLLDSFDRSAALLGGWMLALHPFAVEFSADVQSEGLYLALLLGGVGFLWRALDRASPAYAAAAGSAAALAYLVRPEGLGVALIGGGAGVLLALCRTWQAGFAARWLAALALGTAIFTGPYVVALHHETGAWSLTQKKSVSALVSLSAQVPQTVAALDDEDLEAASLPVQKSLSLANRLGVWRGLAISERLAPAFSQLWRAGVSGMRVELLLLVAIGIFSVRGRPGRRGWFIASFVLLYVAVLFALAMNSGYVSRRHALPALVPLLGYAGLGAGIAARWVLGALARLSGRPLAIREGLVFGIAVGLVACVWLPRDLRSRRDERFAERLAAEWLRSQDAAAGPVAAGRLRVAYYAGAEFVPIPPADTREAEAPLLSYLQAQGARYLVVDEAAANEHAGLERALRSGLVWMHREQARGYSAAVFAVPQVAD